MRMFRDENGMCDPIRLSDSIEGKFVQGVRKYDKEETWRNKGTRKEREKKWNVAMITSKLMARSNSMSRLTRAKIINCKIV